jgi:hypothetical protein
VVLANTDVEILGVIRFFAARGLEAGYLVPTETGLTKSIMDAHTQLSGFLRRTGLHDYSLQAKGPDSKVTIKTWLVKEDSLVETRSSLYRPETKSGDPRIWIYDLAKHVASGNLLANFVHEGELYVVNTSRPGLLDSANDPSSPFSRVLDLLAAAKDKPLEDKFSEWNLRLLRSFFSGASKDEEVFMRVDRALLDQIGQDIGGDAGFLDAVRCGAAWASGGGGLVQRMLSLVSQRATRARNYKDPGEFDVAYRGVAAPPYLPYLAALVRNDSEHPSAYYPGLMEDLKLKTVFGSVEMTQVEAAWLDLEKWTNATKGAFGYFKLRQLGGLRRIGVPRSQSILQQGDVEDLPHVFVQAEVRPGHDLTEQELTRILDEAKARGGFTTAFQSALGNPDFEQPIRAAINAAYADWDGSLPARKAHATSITAAGAASALDDGFGLALVVAELDPLALIPSWRVPSFNDSGQFELVHLGVRWEGSFSGTEGANSNPRPIQDPELWKIAERACYEEQTFDIRLWNAEDAEEEPETKTIVLGERQLWVLVPTFEGAGGGIELREGQLPGSGQAYLLASPRSAGRLREYLQRQNPDHSLITASGLPADWLLACLHECSALTSDQRLLPDGADSAHPMPRAVRFVGGRSIRRGYSRLYLPYDLPSIELDAPDDARILCSEGLELEAVSPTAAAAGTALFKPTRRFKVKLPHSRSAAYEIKAVRGQQVLGQAKLRISGLSGELVDTGTPFSLDSLGRPTASVDGLSGVLSTQSAAEEEIALGHADLFSLDAGELGLPAADGLPRACTHELFLDALASSGGMDYSIARAMLQRLLESTGEQGNPALILLDLRSRGHLEISTTHKGHMSRIHPVEPCLYELPATCGGSLVYGIAGTLRLAHRDSLVSHPEAWATYRDSCSNSLYKPWRLVGKGDEAVSAACSQLNFRHAVHPCLPIASWSGGLGSVREEYLRNTMESIGSAQAAASRFNASKGLFTAKPSGSSCELWRVPDLDTGMDNLYVLSDGGKFAFIRDSRWGVWMALDSFADWASKLPGMEGTHPVPVTYAAKYGTLWLPARISLPCVLERALVLCSGAPPAVLDLQRSNTATHEDRIPLATKSGNRLLLTANCFYDGMASGKWLAYRRVPAPVAQLVVDKLGAVLDVI